MFLIRLATGFQILTTYCFVIFQIPTSFSTPLTFNFNHFDASANDIVYEGDAQPFSGAIELNNNVLICSVGRATYAKPLHLWDSSMGILTDFTTRFSFRISQRNASDGFAFFLASVAYQIPPNSVGGYLGLLKSTTNVGVPQIQIVMVEFDTFHNDKYDPPGEQHIGINNNNMSSLTYRRNSSLSWKIDLTEALPEWVTIGFSGATGRLTERHTIYYWEFSSTLDITEQKRKISVKKVVLVSICAFIFIVIGVSISWLSVKKWRSYKSIREKYGKTIAIVDFDIERGALPKRFKYQVLVAATNGFADDRRLGQGGSGQVYRGTLSDLGRLVAVKRIFAKSENSEKVFINEAKIISRLIHRNLVQFLGRCQEKEELLLVYEDMPNGSLDTHIFGSGRTLPWNMRYKIALGLAYALHYLQEETEQASKVSDMYSFGVVALEIACGRRTFHEGEYHVPLVSWVWKLYVAGDILNAADERLSMDFDLKEMTCLLIVGLWCTYPNHKERPTAGQVIRILHLEASLPELPHDMHENVVHPASGQANSIQSAPITSSLDYGGR
ncbi:Lectin-like receptor kinase [Quillaja saponaria]|uniref:Lectin-like receptor kinase n=1 Tax=Quillaja saponaria TaxID=32244 RepID=A0AAD7LHZ2_QUISA|nr:Lectin-like receptor kinase [Quillaja saponaria]